jgi:subtilisin
VLLLGVVGALAASLPAVAQEAALPAHPLESAAPDEPAPAPERLAPARTGELIVRTARRTDNAGLQQALARANGKALQSLGRGVSLVEVPAGQEQVVAEQLVADPAVVYAEPNYIRTATSHSPAEVGWGVRSTRAPALWTRPEGVTGSNVRVAVLDSGVDIAHPQLRSRVAAGFDAYGGRGRDNCGHGTAVAGVVAAEHDGEETVGVAPEATILPVRVLRYDRFYGACGGDDASIISGLQWAADPARGAADVINMSLSGPQRSRALGDAIRAATSRGVLVVAASGNSGDRTVNYPAAYPGVVSVGGLQLTAGGPRVWPQASFGKVDIAAPATRVPILLATAVKNQPSRIGTPCQSPTGWCSDGTSFAAPHVAGVAALLLEQHPELRAMTPAKRLRVLRQWLLGTAPRVAGRPGGSDLRTGHGRPDAVRAAEVSTNPGATLLTWRIGGRVLAPTSRMVGAPSSIPMAIVASTGTGAPLRGLPVAFRPPTSASLKTSSQVTNAQGVASTALRSSVGGRSARVTATLAGRTLAATAYILHRDDNVPGVRPPSTSFPGSLNVVTDVDDVYRFRLNAGETLRARATGIDRRREQVVLYLHRGTTRDVTDPFRAPLREDPGYAAPERLSVTVGRDGLRYLDVYGFGTYRLRWRILVPGVVRSLTAAPATFSPDGDGYRDQTRLAWRVARRGAVALQIRNSGGRVVRRVAFGVRPDGRQSYRWDGRTGGGRLVRDGTYRAVVRWDNGNGRVSTTSTRVTVNR